MTTNLNKNLLVGIAVVTRRRRLELGLTALAVSRMVSERESFMQELEWNCVDDIDVLLLLRLAEVLRFKGVSDLVNQASLNVVSKDVWMQQLS